MHGLCLSIRVISVHHQLNKFALKHYHSPPAFLNVVSVLYSDLEATVTCRSWSIPAIPLKMGVYQGDPLSVIIFNTVMATLADALKADKHLGYTFSNSYRSMNVLQYADDTCLVADGPSSCQRLLDRVDEWLDWTGMKVKVPKCYKHQQLGGMIPGSILMARAFHSLETTPSSSWEDQSKSL